MADDVLPTEIKLDKSRCIFYKNNIYFSNYYLNEVIAGKSPPFKIIFDDNKFMNDEEYNSERTLTDIKSEDINNNLDNINVLNDSNLDVTLYTQMVFNPHSIDISVNIEHIKDNLSRIFKDTDQIIQYLKYNGFWCTDIKQTSFGDRTKKSEEEGEEEEEEGDEEEGEEEEEEEEGDEEEEEEEGDEEEGEGEQEGGQAEEENDGPNNRPGMRGQGGNKNTTRRNGTNNNQKSKSKKKK